MRAARRLMLCDDSCNGINGELNPTRDGVCDDGGAGSMFYTCSMGTDCTDCGTRSINPPSTPPLQPPPLTPPPPPAQPPPPAPPLPPPQPPPPELPSPQLPPAQPPPPPAPPPPQHWSCAQLPQLVLVGLANATEGRQFGSFCSRWGKGSRSTCTQGYYCPSAGVFQLCEWHPEFKSSWSNCREGTPFFCAQLPPSAPMDLRSRCVDGYCDVVSALPPKHPLPHFLLVANNPLIAPAQWHWLSATWTVVRFNDCKVNWPPATDAAVTEVLFLRDNGVSGYHGKTVEGGLACDQRLQRDFIGRVLHVGGPQSDLPLVHLPNIEEPLSSGTTVVMALRDLYPTAPIVCAGFTFHQGAGALNGFQGHPFQAEARYMAGLQRVYVLPTVEAIDQFDFELAARMGCSPEQPEDCRRPPHGAPPPRAPSPGATTLSAPPTGPPTHSPTSSPRATPLSSPPTGVTPSRTFLRTAQYNSSRTSRTTPPPPARFVLLGGVLLEVLLVMVALRLVCSAFGWALRHTRINKSVRWSPLPTAAQGIEQVALRTSGVDLDLAPDEAVLEVTTAPMSIESTQLLSMELERLQSHEESFVI